MGQSERSAHADLVGWKAIAAFLGVTTMTAQRWESLGMPTLTLGPKLVAANSADVLAWAQKPRRRLRRAA